MKPRPGALCALIAIAAMVAPVHCGMAAGTSSAQAGSTPPTSLESAPIEEVIEASDGGFRFNAYVVRWHGARVLVTDSHGASHLSVGDSIHFLVARSTVGERGVLSFMEHSEGAPSVASAPPPPGASQSATATVDEVLSVTDGEYRFTAYIAEWQGQRVAIPDWTSRQDVLPGAPISFVATHLVVRSQQVLWFFLIHVGTAGSADTTPH